MWGAPQGPCAHGAVGARPDDSGMLWVPQSDLRVHPVQQADAAARPTAGLEAPGLLASLQATVGPAPVLHGMQQLNGALPQPPPSLPIPSGADATAGGTAQPAGTSSVATTTTEVDKQAVAREKNRLAQRRFREKERLKVAQVEAQAEAMQRQLSQLRLENERLQVEHALLEKLLVVRDAILSVVVQLDTLPAQAGQPAQPAQQGSTGGSVEAPAAPSATALLQDPAALQAASQQLAEALGELPSLEQMEAMVAHMGSESGPEGGSSGSSSGGSSSSPAGTQAATSAAMAPSETEAAAAPPPLSAAVGAAAASGAVVERSRLQEVLPPPSPAAQREAQALDHVECLYEYWRQWRMRLSEVYEEAKACDFSDEMQLAALEVHMREPLEVIWAACHVQPKVFNHFLVRCLPPPDVDMSSEWTRIAEESLPLLSDGEIAFFRRSIQRYTKQATIAVVGVRPWVQRLQMLVVAQRNGALSMSQLADQHTQAREVATRLQRACTEQYLACLTFLAEVGTQSRTPVRCKWILAGGEYAPDHLAILNEVVRLHQQRQRQQLPAPIAHAGNARQWGPQQMLQGAADGTADGVPGLQ